MAKQRLVELKPTNRTLYDVKNKTRFVLTRTRAKRLLVLLETSHTVFGKDVIQYIKYELEHGDDDTHIAFYLDDDDIDSFTALQYACMEYTFALIK